MEGEIDEALIDYVARLSHIELDEDEQAVFSTELRSVLEHIRRLDQLDTTDVTPMAHALPGQKNRFRDDEKGASLPREQVLNHAPESDGVYFISPAVMERDEGDESQ